MYLHFRNNKLPSLGLLHNIMLTLKSTACKLLIFNFIMGFWNNLPSERKEKIIDDIVDSFSELFKKYYQSKKEETDK